ncbi:MAG: hypothetical protein V1809_11720 [Planctomycetota bacterium]
MGRKTTAQQIWIGWDQQDITPSKPAELQGQYYQRVSGYVRDPLSATALALESADRRNQAILVSVDLLLVEREWQETLRNRVRSRIPDFDVSRLLINATHVHSAPLPTPTFPWWTPDDKTMTPEECHALLMDRMGKAVVNAWRRRKPGGISPVLGHAVVGHCRRALYADGSAKMYGETARDDFAGMEGNEDHGVDMLFCWDRGKRLTGIVVNLACPSQVMESAYCISADFFGELRRQIHRRYSKRLFVLSQVSAAGDQSPRDLTRRYRGEPNFWSEEGLGAIGRRLLGAVDGAYPAARRNIRQRLVFRHSVQRLRLPLRRVTREEYKQAETVLRRLTAREPKRPNSPVSAYARFVREVHANEKARRHGPFDNKDRAFVIMRNNEAVIERYRIQNRRRFFPMELHVIRLGEVALAGNPFELYLDYGHQIKARSNAQQTFVIQLAGDCGRYLPSARAVAAGGYGALVSNGHVGPEGGRILVDETVGAINSLWA